MIEECTNEEFRVVLLPAVYWTSMKERESLRRYDTSLGHERVCPERWKVHLGDWSTWISILFEKILRKKRWNAAPLLWRLTVGVYTTCNQVTLIWDWIKNLILKKKSDSHFQSIPKYFKVWKKKVIVTRETLRNSTSRSGTPRNIIARNSLVNVYITDRRHSCLIIIRSVLLNVWTTAYQANGKPMRELSST